MPAISCEGQASGEGTRPEEVKSGRPGPRVVSKRQMRASCGPPLQGHPGCPGQPLQFHAAARAENRLRACISVGFWPEACIGAGFARIFRVDAMERTNDGDWTEPRPDLELVSHSLRSMSPLSWSFAKC